MSRRKDRQRWKRINKLIALLTGTSYGRRGSVRNTVVNRRGKPVKGKTRTRFMRELARLALKDLRETQAAR